LEFFRDYLDDSGNVIEGREKNLDAYIYFIDRILPSVNYEVNDYGAVARKNKCLSQCFTVTDEAFALACVENYRLSWERKLLCRESMKAARLGRLEVPEGEVPAHSNQRSGHVPNGLAATVGIPSQVGLRQVLFDLMSIAKTLTASEPRSLLVTTWKSTSRIIGKVRLRKRKPGV
jgi:autotransporter translocation and assembly factor TamB